MNLGELRPGHMLVWKDAANLSSAHFSVTRVRFVIAININDSNVIITWLFRNGTTYSETGHPDWPVYHQWQIIGVNGAYH